MKLIINADDFGLSKSISDGIIEGIKSGYITSTSIMANMEYAEYAIREAVKNNIDCIGLHINFTVGKPIIENSNLTDNNGNFLGKKEQVINRKLTYEDAYNEIIAQIKTIDKYSNGLLKIDHLDIHHEEPDNHISDNINIKNAVIDIAKEYNIPMRNSFECDVLKPDVQYDKFTINNVTINALETMIHEYQNKDTIVELMTHPGLIDDYTKTVTSYIGRDRELQTLKEAKNKGIFNNIELISFKEL